MHPEPLAYPSGLEQSRIALCGTYRGWTVSRPGSAKRRCDTRTEQYSPEFRSGAGLERFPEQLVGHLRVGLATAPLHDLADKEPERLLLPGPVLGDGVGVLRNDVLDDRHQRARIVDLRQALGRDDLVGGSRRLVHPREDVLADRTADRSLFDQLNQ